MNQEVLNKWLAALRSNEYEQTTGALHNKEGFCCLGVLCDLYLKDHDENWIDEANIYTIRSEDGLIADLLPVEVMNWAGLNFSDPVINIDSSNCTSLTELNDDCEYTFDEIAEAIEKKYANQTG